MRMDPSLFTLRDTACVNEAFSDLYQPVDAEERMKDVASRGGLAGEEFKDFTFAEKSCECELARA